MAVTYLNSDSVTAQSSPATATIASFTPSAGSNRILEVYVAGGAAGGAVSTPTVTAGGVSMTQRSTVSQDTIYHSRITKFYLLEADFPTAPFDIVVTNTSSSADEIAAAVHAYSTVDQTTPYSNGTAGTDTQASATPSVNISSATDELMTGGSHITNDAGTLTGTNSMSVGTKRQDVLGYVAYHYLVTADVAGAATSTLTWSFGSTSGSFSSVVTYDSLKQAAAPSGQPARLMTFGVGG